MRAIRPQPMSFPGLSRSVLLTPPSQGLRPALKDYTICARQWTRVRTLVRSDSCRLSLDPSDTAAGAGALGMVSTPRPNPGLSCSWFSPLSQATTFTVLLRCPQNVPDYRLKCLPRSRIYSAVTEGSTPVENFLS